MIDRIINWVSPKSSAEAPEPNYKLGLVLSGGGMRGVAHAGILKVLLDAGIEPDVISGASAGSLIGALYAAGYSPEEMKEFFNTENLFSYKLLAFRKPGILHTDAFRTYLEPYFPKDKFEDLAKPLYVLATNLLSGEGKVFSEGELIKPLMASCAVPGVFAPIEFDQVPYGDGGIYTNFPVEPLKGKCEKLIGIYVHPLQKLEANDLKNPLDVLTRAYEISRSAAVQPKFQDCDHVIIPKEIEPYGVFDRDHLEEMYEAGKKAGEKALDALLEVLQEKDTM